MSKSKVTFKSDLRNVQAEAIKQVTQHYKNDTGFPTKCPRCSRVIAISDGINLCPFCKANINFDLKVEKS